MAGLKQFFLLIWKNFKLQFRHPFVTLFELGIPALFSVILIFIRIAIKSEYVSEPTTYNSFSIDDLPKNLTIFGPPSILYAPNNTKVNEIMKMTEDRLKNINLTGFPDEDSLVKHYLNQSKRIIGAIVFDDIETSSEIKYRIRPKFLFTAVDFTSAGKGGWKTKYNLPFLQKLGPREKDNMYGGRPGYYSSGFLAIEHAVDLSIIKSLNPNFQPNDSFELEMQRYPYPPYDNDLYLFYLNFYLPFMLMLSFVYPCVNIVKNVTLEKERKLREAMKMMGLSHWLNCTAWFTKYILFLCFSSAIITILLTLKIQPGRAVLSRTDPSCLFFILFVYSSCLICFAFFMSSIFSKVNSAAAATGIIFILSTVPYMFIFPRYNDMTFAGKMGSCLLFNTALSIAGTIIISWESTGSGLQWHLFYDTPTPGDYMSMNYALIMIVVDGIIFCILAWYIDAVFPGEYGVPEVWYFPFTRSYWCGAIPGETNPTLFFNANPHQEEFFEKEPRGLTMGIEIRGLTKVYGKNMIPAVNNLYLNMFRGQVTVLLGHNGAGKTTTISMLTGLFPPTSGEAFVNGADIIHDIRDVHSCLGVCPQHDVLFDELTVGEHLYFFAHLKNYIPDLIQSNVNRIIQDVGLEEKRHVQAQNLSGGQKRKLSLAIAFVGGSQVVILDEPTSGMDPSARRAMWDLIQTEKEDRTILLTTHFMEEADIVGDRIAIMAHGEIQCCGSSLFLKKKYGAGYHLVISKEPDCYVAKITDVIKSHIPDAEMSTCIGAELTYILPHESCDKFERLFAEIEGTREELKIDSFGASITTMEEVFIVVGKLAQLKGNVKENVSATPGSENLQEIQELECGSPNEDDYLEITDGRQKNSGWTLFFQQFYALLCKHVLYSRRNWILTLSQLITAPILLGLTLLVLKTLPKPEDDPCMNLNLGPFTKIEVDYELTSSEMINKKMAQIFSSEFPSDKVDVKKVDALTSYLLDQGKTDISYYNRKNLIAAKFEDSDSANKSSITSFFNNQAYHTPAVAVWSIDNAILKYVTNETMNFSISNCPLPRTEVEKGIQAEVHLTSAYQIGQSLIVGFSIIISSFSVFLIKELAVRSKHLQRVSGVNLITFWLAAFLWNFTLYILAALLPMLIFVVSDTDGMSDGPAQARLFVLFIFYGLAIIPVVYCVIFLFQEPATGYVCICLINIIVGVCFFLFVTITDIPMLKLQYVSRILDWIFSATFPTYNLGRSVSNMYQNYQLTSICNSDIVKLRCRFEKTLEKSLDSEQKNPCCPDTCGDECFVWTTNYYSISYPGIGKHLLFLSIQSVFCLLLLIAIEWKVFRYMKYRFRFFTVMPPHSSNVVSPSNSFEDNDVYEERLKILRTPLTELQLNNRLTVKELSKHYGPLVAVNKISFGVQRGECFGLLGLNGAGKTSTFKMITGETSITSGEIYLDSFGLKQQMRKAQQRLGYCPQFDALIDQLTGRETLTLYARLRGLKERIIPSQVTKLSSILSLGMYIDRKVKAYSGGNKRKLSVAIALLGDPPLILLDEPTSGMDPVSRQKIWNVLIKVLNSGRSIVLTSHSMEECEALCQKLVIMVNGRFCCLGSPQHLKHKFGQGFTLLIKVGHRSFPHEQQMSRFTSSGGSLPTVVPPHLTCDGMKCHEEDVQFKKDIDAVKAFVEQTFTGCVLKDVHEGFLHYHIPNPELSWSEMFGSMERAKQTLNIIDYSVGQTTLEQVFLNFARAQRDSVV